MQKRKILSVVGCIIVQACVGILYLWSIFRSPAVRDYSMSESASTMVSPLMLTFFVLGNLIGGYFQDKTNPRLIATIGAGVFCIGIFLTSFLSASTNMLIFLTYCGMGGIGCGCTYGSVLSCLQKWYPKKRGFAAGIAVASFSASTVVFGPVSQILLDLEAFSARPLPYTFLTLSIVFSILSMAACLFIRLPIPSTADENNSNAEEVTITSGNENIAHPNTITAETKEIKQQRQYSPIEAMKTLPFWCIALTLFFINGTWNIVVPLIKDLGMTRGLEEAAAVATVTITGITNTLGRFSMATVSDKLGRASTVILLAVVTMLSALVLIFAKGYFFMVIIALLAFCYGGPSSTLPAMTTDLYGTKYGGTNYGIAMLGLGISSIVFNLLSILINNQTASFVMGAGTALIAALLMLLSIHLTKKNKS